MPRVDTDTITSMAWLQSHWLALAGLGVLGWAADSFQQTLTTLASGTDQPAPGLTGLVDLVTTRANADRTTQHRA